MYIDKALEMLFYIYFAGMAKKLKDWIGKILQGKNEIEGNGVDVI